MTDVGKNIRDARLAAGLTQDELAERVHVARQTVSNYETGFSRPDVDMLLALSDALRVSIDALVRGGEEPKADPGEGRRKPAPMVDRREAVRATLGLAALVILVPGYLYLLRWAQTVKQLQYRSEPILMVRGLCKPLLLVLLGWTLLQALGTFFDLKRLPHEGGRWVRLAATVCLVLYVLVMLPGALLVLRNTWLMWNGERSWAALSASGPWRQILLVESRIYLGALAPINGLAQVFFFLLGGLLWLSGGKRAPVEDRGKETAHGEES